MTIWNALLLDQLSFHWEPARDLYAHREDR